MLTRIFVCACVLVTSAAYNYDSYYSEDYSASPEDSLDLPQYSYSYETADPINYKDDYDYFPTRTGLRNRGIGNRYNYRYRNKPSMQQYEKSYHMKPKKVVVPVVIKKKKTKKKKILSTHHGFYTPGGTQIFGKFKDLHSCQKACEITPTCFAGDFNPWLGKCYLHSNLTACAPMRSHKAITHFKKVPCQILETTRGYVVIGASVTNGIEMKGIKSLQDCIKKCASAGGGVAATNALIATTPQICCHIDYDFSTHKCYFHLCINMALAIQLFCAAVPEAPLNSIPNPTTISITFCPLVAK